MSIRSRLSLSLVLVSALAVLVALVGTGGAAALPKIPKKPSYVSRNVAVSASGTLTYRWTFDNRAKCTPGYSKTVEEELRFDFPSRKTHLTVAFDRLVIPALRGGSSQTDVRLGGWQTTNYCPPQSKAPEPEQPTCKSGASPLILAITSTAKEVPLDEDDLAPLSRESQISVIRTKPLAQDQKCGDHRPSIPFDFEHELGWFADPQAGFALGMNAGVSAYAGLTKGKMLRRQIQVSGGCGGASAHASQVAPPSNITSCTLNGVIFVKLTGTG